jgi:ribonuclease HIII
MIGSDEALKGDTFGGIVVAAVKANNKTAEKLQHLGVQDSKRITDKKILQLAPQIQAITDNIVKNIYPEEYNKFNGNVTQLLNKLHKECYTALKPGKHIVDKYPGCTVGDIIETKAEESYIEVAAASILARAAALEQLDNLSKHAGFVVPKGSTHVLLALKKLQKMKLDPNKFVKLHFKNVQKALEIK